MQRNPQKEEAEKPEIISATIPKSAASGLQDMIVIETYRWYESDEGPRELASRIFEICSRFGSK